MNLFFLDFDIKKCAEYHCDKHVVKMILELTQMLYTAHHVINNTVLKNDCYKPIKNFNHPMCIWVRTSKNNYLFTVHLAICLSEEYTYRYGKVHSCYKHLIFLQDNIPECVPVRYPTSVFLSKKVNDLTPIPLCMPNDCKTEDPIEAYRNYYIRYKWYFVKWTNRKKPQWFSLIRKYFVFN